MWRLKELIEQRYQDQLEHATFNTLPGETMPASAVDRFLTQVLDHFDPQNTVMCTTRVLGHFTWMSSIHYYVFCSEVFINKTNVILGYLSTTVFCKRGILEEAQRPSFLVCWR